MRKRHFTLAAGIAAMMMVAVSGCSPKTQETETSAVETTVEETTTEETKEETTVAPTEKTEETTTEEAPSSGSPAPESALDVPLKIWGTITEVTNRAIYVDNQSPNSSTGEIVLTIDPETTRILDGGSGFPVEMKDIEIGNFEAYLGPAMTMSLPPQAVPYVVIVNTPEDHESVEYVIAADSVKEDNGKKVLAGKDGKEYTLAEEVSIVPFLTKQLVRLEDIGTGSECLVWMNDEKEVERIVLFNE